MKREANPGKPTISSPLNERERQGETAQKAPLSPRRPVGHRRSDCHFRISRIPWHLRRASSSGSTAAARSTAARSSRRAKSARVMGFTYSGQSRTRACPARGVSGGRCPARPCRWRSSTASKQGRCYTMTISSSAAVRRAWSARCGSCSAWSKSRSTKRSAGAVRVRRKCV